MASSRVGRFATFARVSPRATRGNARARAVVRGASSSPPRDEMRRSKLRLLCLHSFRTSGEILREQVRLAGWEETLGDLVEFHVMDAPHPASGPVPPDVLAFFPDVPYREWWNATERADPDGSGRKTMTMTYVGLEESLERVKREFDERGPFDGVLGFSQGATLTTILAAKGVADAWGPFADANASRDASRPKPKKPPVFAVCVSGAAARTREADATYRAARDANANADVTDASASASNVSTPSLHIIGEADRVVPPPVSARAAARCFVNPVVAKHPRGHVVPRLEGNAAETVREFFLARIRERTEEGTETVPDSGARTTSAL